VLAVVVVWFHDTAIMPSTSYLVYCFQSGARLFDSLLIVSFSGERTEREYDEMRGSRYNRFGQL
jgi:hypothetical protein